MAAREQSLGGPQPVPPSPQPAVEPIAAGAYVNIVPGSNAGVPTPMPSGPIGNTFNICVNVGLKRSREVTEDESVFNSALARILNYAPPPAPKRFWDMRP